MPWQPGQRAGVGGCKRCDAPVQHGRHIVCGSKVASAGSCQHVAQWMFIGFGREGEQVGSKRWPSGFPGEPGNVVVG
jgi:hypothetical protein